VYEANPRPLEGPLVAANPQDRWVFMGAGSATKIVVINRAGEVFYHPIGDRIGDHVQLQVPDGGVAAKPQDKWVLNVGLYILVITQEGRVFAHKWDQDLFVGPGGEGASLINKIDPAFQLKGPNVAANPQDKWVLHDRFNRIVVITRDGDVFAHPYSGGDHIDEHVQLQVPDGGVAAKPQDKWVLMHGEYIVVVTEDGGVFAHFIGRDVVSEAVNVEAPRVAANPEDHFLSEEILTPPILSNDVSLFVITQTGHVFTHLTSGFGPHF
jgi:hypothetical protein